MQIPKRKNAVVFLAVVVILVVSVVMLETNLQKHTHGEISFPRDNAYLNISTARSLTYFKVWSISKSGFQSATAAPLYPLLLAVVFFITGAHLVIPLVLNGLAAILLLYVLQKALIQRRVGTALQFGILLAVLFLSLLPLLVVSGMGYAVQLLIGFLFVESLSAAIPGGAIKLPKKVYLYGVLAVAAGYEDFLLILLACILLFALRRKWQAFILAGFSLIPAVVFGIISVLKGEYFLPTPFITTSFPGYLIALTAGSLLICFLLIRRYHKLSAPTTSSIHQLSFALLLVMMIPFSVHNLVLLGHFQRDSVRIYEEQYLPAAFVRRYYHESTIGVNHIGAVAYFSDCQKLDFTGISDVDVAKSMEDHSWGPVLADSLTRKTGVRMAIISEPWFSSAQLPNWHKVASWELAGTQSGTDKTISFYSTNKWDTVRLKRYLRDFRPQLPANVSVRYY